jgi:hypothetical protein
MKDYSNYYSPVKDKMLNDAEVVFDIQLEGNEGFDVVIDNIPCRVLIYNHLNSMNEFKEERVITCNKNTNMHRGSSVEFQSEKYLITSDVDDHIVSFKAKMQKCNNILTFKNSLNKTIKIPCIITNLTLYSDGLETKTITSLDGKRNVIIPLNKDSKDLFVQQRFIFNHNSCFSVSLIDDFTTVGLLKLTMIQEEFGDKDDRINNLAYNAQNLPITISFSQNNYIINKNNTMKLNPIIMQGDKILNLPVNYTVDNPFITVDNLGNVIAINSGDCKVVCRLVDNSDVYCILDIRVVPVNPVQAINYLITGNSEIRKTSTVQYSCKKMLDNVEDISASFNFTLNYNGLSESSVGMTLINGNSVKIKSNTDSGNIILKAKDIISGVVTEKVIVLKGIYG